MFGCREGVNAAAHALPEWAPVRCARSLNVATRMRAILRGSTLVRRRDPSTRGYVEVWRNLGGWDTREPVGPVATSLRINGGGREIRTPMRLAARWISSSLQPRDHQTPSDAIGQKIRLFPHIYSVV